MLTTVHPQAPFSDLHAIDTTTLPNAHRLEHRYLLVRGMVGSTPVYQHNIYAPQDFQSRVAFFDALPCSFEHDALHLAGGDFNVILHDVLDSVQPTMGDQTGRESLKHWLGHLNLVDVFRTAHLTRRVITSPRSINRLDYIFASNQLCRDSLSRAGHIHGTTHSDHSACTLLLSPTLLLGKGPWTTPTWLLHTTEARAIVIELLTTFCDTTSISPKVGRAYDEMIYAMRTRFKQLHDTKSAQQHAALKQLKANLATALMDWVEYQTETAAELVAKLKQDVKEEMQRLAEFKAEAGLHRTLVQAERCTKQHLRPPTPRPIHKPCIRAITNSSGTLQETNSGIQAALHSYYESLYTAAPPADPAATRSYIYQFQTPPLPADLARRLAAQYVASEFYAAIKAASREKAPGPNALPFEVLKLAPSEWAQVLELVFSGQLYNQPALTPG